MKQPHNEEKEGAPGDNIPYDPVIPIVERLQMLCETCVGPRAFSRSVLLTVLSCRRSDPAADSRRPQPAAAWPRSPSKRHRGAPTQRN